MMVTAKCNHQVQNSHLTNTLATPTAGFHLICVERISSRIPAEMHEAIAGIHNAVITNLEMHALS